MLAQVVGLSPDDDGGVDPARAAAYLRQHRVAEALVRGPAPHQRLPQPPGDAGQGASVTANLAALALLRRCGRYRAQVRRLADDRDLAERRTAWAVGTHHSLDVALEVIGGGPERDDGDAVPLEHLASQRRVDLLLELRMAVELALKVIRPPSRRGEIALQALLEALGGIRDHVVAEAHANQDPDGQRQKDRGQRGRVV